MTIHILPTHKTLERQAEIERDTGRVLKVNGVLELPPLNDDLMDALFNIIRAQGETNEENYT